ncbi:hypothetical protein [Streptomyces uncialis]|uniref:hypothetical protein n=1 Tax=Streptomyces uncialis TaxID=1048205 RepID=UPI0033D213DE
MNTLLDYSTVTLVLALLLGPITPGYLRERRIDRELRDAGRGRPGHPEGQPGRSLDLAA